MSLNLKKKSSPLVSIIMNCHNGEKYLKQSIKSIIDQKYKNWELIFFDNSSLDKSLSIAKSFHNKKIKIFKSKKYLKLYDARNFAVKAAKGKFISFLDVDDLWHPLKLHLQVKYVVENKKKFVFSNYLLLKGKKKNISGYLKFFKQGYVTQSLLDNYWLGIVTVLMSRSLFKKRKFNPNYEIIGDFDFFINISIKNFFGYIDQPLAYYRVHKNNFSQRKIDLWADELKIWLDENQDILQKKGFKLFNQKKYLYKLRFKKIFKNLNEKLFTKYL